MFYEIEKNNADARKYLFKRAPQYFDCFMSKKKGY
jgi:hypothetical protein